MYKYNYCLECSKCGKIYRGDINYDMKKSDCCGVKLICVSCKADKTPPVSTVKWDDEDWTKWRNIQKKKRIRKKTLDNIY